MSDFYDQLAPFYHLIYPDWDASILRQAQQLSALIEEERPGCRKVLDVSCGIGTQAIALATRGYAVSASDISEKSIARARQEQSRAGCTSIFLLATCAQHLLPTAMRASTSWCRWTTRCLIC